MDNLIIIGNGFDLAHGLKTDYASFIKDIEQNTRKYGLSTIKENHFLSTLKANNDKDLYWSDVENYYYHVLTHAEHDIYQAKDYSPKQLNQDFEQVKQFLAKYLHQQEAKFKKNENYELLFKYLEQMEDVVVLNFNQTNTVKKYLDDLAQPNVQLIQMHGELSGDKEDEHNPIIFGYAPSEQESEQLLGQNPRQMVRNIKKFNYLFTDNEDRLLQQLSTGKSFNVYIFGHSCGMSDKQLLNQIFSAPKLHRIYPFYYTGSKGHSGRDHYFSTMVNINSIVAPQGKGSQGKEIFRKLRPYPHCMAMPQKEKAEGLRQFLLDAEYERSWNALKTN